MSEDVGTVRGTTIEGGEEGMCGGVGMVMEWCWMGGDLHRKRWRLLGWYSDAF